MTEQKLRKAIAILGGQRKLGHALGIGQPAVANWIRRGRVPPERCLAIELATHKRVTRYELRPDVFGRGP